MSEGKAENIARVCHEANRAYCATLGDLSQTSWEDAPGWQRESAIEGVHKKLANPDATPADQHGWWMEQKLRDGWRYGATKDPEAKTHPCLLPYDELPVEQKRKDALFAGIVKALAG